MILSATSVQDSLTKKKKPATENYFDIREENAVRLFIILIVIVFDPLK